MLLVKTILGGVTAIIAAMLSFALWPVPVPELEGISRVEVFDLYNGGRWLVDDVDLVNSFVRVANRHRRWWHLLWFIECATNFNIKFLRNDLAQVQSIQIAPERAYRLYGKRHVAAHNPSVIVRQLLPLVSAAIDLSKGSANFKKA